MKKVKQTVLYLVAFAVALFLLMVVINLPVFDEELLPEVNAIKNIKAKPYGEDNAYSAILALSSKPGPSLEQASQIIRDHLNQQIATNGKDYLTQEAYQQLVGKSHEDSWKSLYYSCKSRTEKNCMESLIDDLKGKSINDPRLREQLKRYADLIDMKAYKGATQLDINSPYVGIGSTQQLKRIFLADAYINQSSDVYLQYWGQDFKFWRMVLAESHLLITRMLSIASVTNSVDSLSTAIRQGALSPQQLIQIQRQIKPLSKSELDMGTTFEYEFKYGVSWFDAAEHQGGIGNLIENALYQPKATQNLNYEYITKRLIQVSALDSKGFYLQVTGKDPVVKFTKPFNWSPTTLYNPVGKQLIGYAIPAYNDYISRAHDLNGMISLLKLQIEITVKPNQKIENIIQSSQHTNPYTGDPMMYNKDTNSIYFECLDPHSSCELVL